VVQSAPIIVVGAGSAGAVIASRLTQVESNHVLLLEAGADDVGSTRDPRIAGTDYLQALEVPGRVDRSVHVTRTSEQGRVPYVQGSGVGGSSMINGLVGMWGLPGDYNMWERDFGCTGWSWSSVEPVFRSLPISLYQVPRSGWGTADHLLAGAATDCGIDLVADISRTTLDGFGAAHLIIANGRRDSVSDVYLNTARGRPNLEIRANSSVGRILFNGNVASGVQLDDGQEIEAKAVIVCTGAIRSPSILQRSNVQLPGIGSGLSDHVSVVFNLKVSETVPSDTVTSMLIRASSSQSRGDIQILPLNRVGSDPSIVALCVALMQVRSRGSVISTISDSKIAPTVDFNMLSESSDVERLNEGVKLLLDLVGSATVRERTLGVYCDALGTPADLLRDMSENQLADWTRHNIGNYFHAAGTCRMGSMTDEMAVVDSSGRVFGYDNLWVCDASIMPTLPRANPYLPVVMVAEISASNISQTFN